MSLLFELTIDKADTHLEYIKNDAQANNTGTYDNQSKLVVRPKRLQVRRTIPAIVIPTRAARTPIIKHTANEVQARAIFSVVSDLTDSVESFSVILFYPFNANNTKPCGINVLKPVVTASQLFTEPSFTVFSSDTNNERIVWFRIFNNAITLHGSFQPVNNRFEARNSLF
jgi:hypothetical protein